MAEGNLTETVSLLYDFKYTIPGSKQEPVTLKSGERFKLVEKKSKNWYLVSKFETNELFFIPVSYSEIFKQPVQKPDKVPPKLPAKPKNLLEKFRNDLEVELPIPPTIEKSAKIELFKLLSNLPNETKASHTNHAKSYFHKSDSHVDQIGSEPNDVLENFNKEDQQFNSLTKVSVKKVQNTEETFKPPKSPISPKPFTSQKSLSTPKHSIHSLPKLPPKPQEKILEIHTDEVSGRQYFYNSLTKQSTWLPLDKLNDSDYVNISYDDITLPDQHDTDNKDNDDEEEEEEEKKEKEDGAKKLYKAGPLNRTKLTGGDRKLKKYWYCTYAVLEDSNIRFYKDKKTSTHKSKSGIELDLKGSLVLKGGTHNKQNIIQVITSSGSEYLLQSNDEDDIQDWYKVLTEASSINEESKQETNSKVSSNTELNENLSSSTTTLRSSAEKSRLMDKLKTWLGRRPTQEALKEKGIYKDVTFGGRLEDICDRDKGNLPIFMLECMQEVEKRGLFVDGIYRISGNISEIQKLRLAVDSYSKYDLAEADIHTVTGTLKMFLRELQEPVVPFRFYQPLLDAYYQSNKVEVVRCVIKEFPPQNYHTLQSLIQHLLVVVNHSRVNRMQVNNLAIIFGPNLLWPSDSVDTNSLASSLMSRGQFTELLLNHYHAVFF